MNSVPSSVQHFGMKISRALGKEITPAWDAGRKAWMFEISEEQECSEAISQLMSTHECGKGKHVFTVRTVHARTKRTHGMNSWTTVRSTIQIDDREEEEIPLGIIASLLSSPTNPQGDGKVGSANQGAPNQSLDTKKNTVIRV